MKTLWTDLNKVGETLREKTERKTSVKKADEVILS